ncbi:hypothetical protein E2C01_094314 [Portunus trituberculatus]|uniref:Uncharacterized protein n=1 Tax=Portunus trituberculatus TaxID=210409 RepID=A0A5B7K1B9_PORTR|nr:hypothetical protein [Portunus trituberculatus]
MHSRDATTRGGPVLPLLPRPAPPAQLLPIRLSGPLKYSAQYFQKSNYKVQVHVNEKDTSRISAKFTF